MKTIYLTLILSICNFGNLFAQRQIQKPYISVPSSTEEQILYLKDSTKGILSCGKSPREDEVNYISNGVSNVGFTSNDNRVYIWWNSCDDMTNSKYVIYKTTDNTHYELVSEITNIPSNIHYPILYCTNFTNDTPYNNQFFLFYKQYENGYLAHIITLIVPKQSSKKILSKL